jgi:hypothetical protein
MVDSPTLNTATFSRQTVAIWQDDSRLRQEKVIVCTEACTFAGYAFRMHHQRLLDALNQSLAVDSFHAARNFMPLARVEACISEERREPLADTYIRKANILFVCQKSVSGNCVPQTNDRPKVYPMREKKPIRAEVHLSSYTLVGLMYGEMWQQLLDSLDRDETFLPVTNVIVRPALSNGESAFDFVAINKDRIIYVNQLGSADAPGPVPDGS